MHAFELRRKTGGIVGRRRLQKLEVFATLRSATMITSQQRIAEE